jgi:hypothetical protein
MRTGVYAVLAVVVGVMLVGMLPGQLSNLAAPAMVQTVNFQSTAHESTTNLTSTTGDVAVVGRGFSNSSGPFISNIPDNSTKFTIAPSSIKTASNASTAATQASTAANAAATAAQAGSKTDTASIAETTDRSYNLYADLGYYAMWGVGLMAALGIYFVSKRMLG